MTKTKLSPQLMRALPDLLTAAAALYVGYWLKKGYQVGDKVAETATAPAGQLWSDFSAWAGGWQPVELTDLIIQPWYLDNNYRLTDEAYKTLSKAYPKEVEHFFSNRVLKSHYWHLIGQPIRGF
ncbi:hypothetical protein [Shewanella subflava]|uniref:Uncharacterized protein n=1 Tax=Shewanella subflava TaxID=2986476 RepID=A0ABT3ICF4_9GAMM|nr:hypothetical protein [Shewanella subflava]MCW3173746.1 hypothetical protein [Shewanella subflava]